MEVSVFLNINTFSKSSLPVRCTSNMYSFISVTKYKRHENIYCFVLPPEKPYQKIFIVWVFVQLLAVTRNEDNTTALLKRNQSTVFL